VGSGRVKDSQAGLQGIEAAGVSPHPGHIPGRHEHGGTSVRNPEPHVHKARCCSVTPFVTISKPTQSAHPRGEPRAAAPGPWAHPSMPQYLDQLRAEARRGFEVSQIRSLLSRHRVRNSPAPHPTSTGIMTTDKREREGIRESGRRKQGEQIRPRRCRCKT
jgi:hypothetical protein